MQPGCFQQRRKLGRQVRERSPLTGIFQYAHVKVQEQLGPFVAGNTLKAANSTLSQKRINLGHHTFRMHGIEK